MAQTENPEVNNRKTNTESKGPIAEKGASIMQDMQSKARGGIDRASEKARDLLNRTEISEGNLTKRIEQQTAKIPSVGFLSLAIDPWPCLLDWSSFPGKKM